MRFTWRHSINARLGPSLWCVVPSRKLHPPDDDHSEDLGAERLDGKGRSKDSETLMQLHTIRPSCTKNEGQLRDKPFRSIAATGKTAAAAARNPSADQQD